MKGFLTILLLTIFAGRFIPLHAQQQPTAAMDEETVRALMKAHNIPVVGLGIIKEGKVSYIKVLGQLTANEPAPPNTLFNIASLTKPVVTMLTLKLVSLGAWSLDEPLSHYWIDPDVQQDSNAYRITSRHVLSHQSGFVNWRWLHPTKKLTFDFTPGTKFQYSGEGFEYLRKALEKKMGQPLDQLCASLVFDPLQMRDSRMTWGADVAEARFAKWHDKEGKNTYPTWKPQRPNAADDMLTTVEDYSRFGAAVVNGFGLPDSVFRDMITPRAAIGKNNSMCLGWEYFEDLGDREYALLHTGSDIGVKTLVLLFPHSRQGLVVFTNSDNGYLLYEKLIPLALGNLGTAFLKKAQ